MILKIKENIKEEIYNILKKEGIEKEEIIIENPKDSNNGDIAIPCFSFAKKLKKSPIAIAESISEKLNYNSSAINGYLNITLDKEELGKEVINKILKEKEKYGNLDFGKNKTVVLDYSAPNIAKPFGVGHLRSTVIGNSINKILKKTGHNTVTINYLGDFGSQFGKLIYAYKTWGNEDAMNDNMIKELKRLYVLFHEEAEKDESLNDKGRAWFKKLEDEDEEAVRIWEWFREESLKEFQKTYDLLGINSFDSYNGEAYYNDKMNDVITMLEDKKLLKEDDGAMVVDLGEGKNPALIKTSDGTTLYITRDLAAIYDRYNNYNFDEILYVVGNEQTLHFTQLKEVLEKLDAPFKEKMKHISFGMILEGGKRMSTRKGRAAELQYVLEEAIKMATDYINEKNPDLKNKDQVSRQVGVGAVVFNDLKTYRKNDVDFDLRNILKFEGATGPYLQYTNARINSILDENTNEIEHNIKGSKYINELILKLMQFEEAITMAKDNYDPSEIAKYLLKLAALYNSFYGNERINVEEEKEKQYKVALSKCVSIVLEEGLRLLSVESPKEM